MLTTRFVVIRFALREYRLCSLQITKKQFSQDEIIELRNYLDFDGYSVK